MLINFEKVIEHTLGILCAHQYTYFISFKHITSFQMYITDQIYEVFTIVKGEKQS